MRIGILALQGDFAEHASVLRTLGAETTEVRLPRHLEGLDGLILPGGESTTIGKLAVQYGLMDPLREFGLRRPMWGTCAGAILLSRDAHRNQPLLNLMDITVARNAFGPQIASFETDLEIPALHSVDPAARPYHAVFIRAPLIESVRGDARVLAALPDGWIVAAQEGRRLATSFHPELTPDSRFHRYFLAFTAAAASFSTGSKPPPGLIPVRPGSDGSGRDSVGESG
jgi:5'-phosphate synthase pdxT subunit